MIFCLVLVGTACAAASPLAMITLDRLLTLDWVRLGNIGQAYGLASAIFSVLAVTGVAISLGYQGRSIVVQRDQGVSDAHSRLLMIVLSDPATFGPVMSDRAETMTLIEYKRHVFVTLALRMAYRASKPAT